MKCIITYTSSTENEDFYSEGADATLLDLGKVSLNDVFAPLDASPDDPAAVGRLLPDHRDAEKEVEAAAEPAGGERNAWYDADGERGSWYDAGIRLTNPWFDATGDRGSWYDAGVRMK